MTFFTGIHDSQTDKIHLSLDYIGKKYMRSFFVIDVVTSVPNNFLFFYMVSCKKEFPKSIFNTR